MTDRGAQAAGIGSETVQNPWPALWALMIGFFVILVDTTIVSVANPAIKAALDPNTPNLDNVVWVTSAYLLTYSVPLLITGRLGDRFGPRTIYLIGLVVFTLASLACGLSGTLEALIIARAVQGVGAALMTPQTMAVITRTFPANRRGTAMGLWGATSGVAMLVGPLAGGFLVDGFGWEWVFFINVPVGIIGFVLAWFLVPRLPTHGHRFDILGVALSASGMFLLVFGLQEANTYDWGTIWGPISVWLLIGLGLAMMVLFVWQQSRTRREALVPLGLFRSRNFSLSGIGVGSAAFALTAFGLPTMFYLQLARGLTPTEAALLMIPTAVLTGVLAAPAGRALDRFDPRFLLVPGLGLVAISFVLYSVFMGPDTPIWLFLIPHALLGIGSAGMWGPLATTATRDLPVRQAGAGSSVFNTMRTIGAVMGSAAVAAIMQVRLEANLPGAGAMPNESALGLITGPAREGFIAAMSQATLLPVAAMLAGLVAVVFTRRPVSVGSRENKPLR